MIKLNDYRRSVYSQSGEDGILEKLFQTLGIFEGQFCEFGASDGMSYCNTRKLREEGWSGVLIEGDPAYSERLKNNLRDFKNVQIIESFISCENGNTLDDLLKDTKLKENFDFISIDIDGNDLWIWKSIQKYDPKVVMVEYNSNYPSTSSLCIKYNKDHRHQLDAYYSATAGAYKKLADEKGYKLVGFTEGLNLVFCKKDISSELYEYPLDEIPLLRVWPVIEGRDLLIYE
jgi:hypothetical protein